LADGDTGLAGVFPAAWAGVLPEIFFGTFASGFFLATGFAPRLDGECFDERPDFADAGFFFAGFFAVLAFDGLAERFGARDLGVGRLRAGFERGFALRLAFALDLGRDFFTGFETFLAMIVLLLRRALVGRTAAFLDISRDWGESGKLQTITCA
jgi:hypothetical protein